jgi:hypothetical protein
VKVNRAVTGDAVVVGLGGQAVAEVDRVDELGVDAGVGVAVEPEAGAVDDRADHREGGEHHPEHQQDLEQRQVVAGRADDVVPRRSGHRDLLVGISKIDMFV